MIESAPDTRAASRMPCKRSRLQPRDRATSLTDAIMHDEAIAMLRERLGDRELEHLCAQGRMLSEDAATREATALLSSPVQERGGIGETGENRLR